MLKKIGFFILAAGMTSFWACSDDDGTFKIKDIPQDERNELDDLAILQYLEDHYFETEFGMIKSFNDSIQEDETTPSLLTLGTKLPSGVWVVKRPEYEAEGPAVTDNSKDSILISFNSARWVSSDDDLAEGQRLYEKNTATFFNTIYTTGTPAWDPLFYYVNITPAMEENEIDESFFVIPGFVEGLKQFQSTDTDGVEVFDFQGAILVPSRAAYGRRTTFLEGQKDPIKYRDNCFVFNLELHKVIPRQE